MQLGAVAATLLFTGCSSVMRPDLERLYTPAGFETRRPRAEPAEQPPVVVVPGLLGTRLFDDQTGEEVWPGSLAQLAFGSYREIGLPFDDVTLEPRPNMYRHGGITETAVGRDFYHRLLQTLEQFGGFARTEPGTKVTDRKQRRFYVFAYDWRQDNVRSAQLFDAFLAQIRRDYGDDNLKVDIVAHSMGGLMTRYYLRFGTVDVLNDNALNVTWAGAVHVNKVILLGTPNLGSVNALLGFVRGQPIGFGSIPPEVVATMPSAYQLLPHRIVDWLYDADGRPVDLDQFDADTWRRLRWGVFDPAVRTRVAAERGETYLAALERYFARYVERARRFSWSLTVCPNYDNTRGRCPDQVANPPIRYVVFGGSCALTTARLVLQSASGTDSAEPTRDDSARDDSARDKFVRDEFARDAPDGAARLATEPSEVDHPRLGVDYQRLMLDPGDGTVTKPSLLARDALEPYTPRHQYSYFPLASAFLLCERHDQLTGNLNFQDNLLDVLFTRAKPWELHLDHSFARP